MKKWTIEDSKELYNISGWGTSYFGVNDKGNVYVTPCKNDAQVDLREVMDDLALRDITSPVLLRFPDILDNRIEKTTSCFKKAAEEYKFKGENFIIYPIKVNQMQPVVEEVISHGKKFNLGLEAGSKPELHAVIAVQCQSDSLIICNGYKDQSYIELALLAQKMGKRVMIGGKVFTLSGNESEEYLQRVAIYINNKLAEYNKIESYRKQSVDSKNVLLQLNIADDYFQAKKKISKLEEELERKEKELYDLKHELISTQIKLESTEKTMKSMQGEINEGTKKILRLEAELKGAK